MIAINWKTSWPLVEAAIRDHNRSHITGTRKDGKAAFDLNKVLRTPHQHLLKEMIRLYSRQLAGLEWLQPARGLPPFRTHCGELAGLMGLCKATIHNQLRRLIASGLVVEKVHMGRKSRFTLRFTEGILSVHPGFAANSAAPPKAALGHLAENHPLGCGECKTLQQPPETGNPIKENKLPVETVENDVWPPSGKPAAPGGGDLTGDPQFQEAGNAAKRGKTRCTAAGRQEETQFQDSGKRGASAERPAPAPDSDPFASHKARLLLFITGTLYRGLDFMARSQLDAVKRFIHAQFEGKTLEEGEEAYRDLRARVGIAWDWVRKKPGRYIPIPARYFEAGNLNGFDRTARWLENMRMTNARAEKARQRFQHVSKAIGAVLHCTGKHLEEQGIHSYTGRRGQVAGMYPHLAAAFDWIVLDPRANLANAG